MRRRIAATLFALSGCVDLTHNDAPDPAKLHAALAAGGGTHADVAIALGCPTDEAGDPSLCERCRVKSALRALRAGEVDAVIMSGGAAHNQFIEAQAMGALALRRGLAPGALLLEPRALTTWMNLRNARRLMREHGYRTALIVSTANHLPRARRFAEYWGIDARYRACDLDLPPDSEAEWQGPLGH
jgi:uncharacterized SAM-binding protein YcdF (DUF218 family)